MVQVRRGLSAYRAMQDLPQTIAERHPEPVADSKHRIETMPAREIRFENVSFRYPGSEVDVLRELDLTLHAHEALALVGVNGAGKSTLVKLLGGAYRPTSGRISSTVSTSRSSIWPRGSGGSPRSCRTSCGSRCR